MNIYGMAVIAAMIFSGCAMFSSDTNAPLETVPSVDVKRYEGKWYEIASFPFSFQNGCTCTTAEYRLREDGVLSVINTCNKEGEISQADGKAFVVEGSNNAKLRVQFFWPFRGDYWVIDLADDYSYAVVGVPNRKYCWILSRTKTMDEGIYAGIVERVRSKGFDVTNFNRTVQNCPQ